MTVYLPRRGRTWYYDFWWRGRRYRNTTGQLTREDAQLAEAKLKIRLRQEAGGIGAFDPARTPRIQDWAEVYAEHALRKPINEERLNGLVRCVLRFWGARPSKPEDVDATAPYHDLRLGDPIADAAWLQRWEDWLGTRACPRDGPPNLRPDTQSVPLHDAAALQGGLLAEAKAADRNRNQSLRRVGP